MNFTILRRFYLALALLIFAALPNAAQQADPAFGESGFTATSSPLIPFVTARSSETGVKAFYLPGGGILAVRRTHTLHVKSPPENSLYLIYYTPNGDTGSILRTVSNFVPTDAAMQPDGKIVVVGHTFQTPNEETGEDWKIVRFTTNFLPDSSFRTNGVVTRSFGSNRDFMSSIDLQADGKILVSGTSFVSPLAPPVTVAARYNADGTVDGAFGPYNEGFFYLSDDGSVSRKIIALPDGKLLLAGSSPNGDAFLARYNPGGTVDAAFGSGGYATLNYGNFEILNDLRLQPDGKILVLLDSKFDFPGTIIFDEQTSVLARFTASGLPDSTFGAGGDVFINISPPTYGNEPNFFELYRVSGYESARSILVRDNGNILISGQSQQLLMHSSVSRQRKYLFYVLEYSGGGQFINKNFSRRAGFTQIVARQKPVTVEGSLLQPDGKILLYGSHDASFNSTGIDTDIALARYVSVSGVNDANNFFDYNFNGKDDYAVYRPNDFGIGTWYFMKSRNFDGTEYQFDSRDYGERGDILTPGDYDGDGVQDLAVFRPATGTWITGDAFLDNCAPMTCVDTIQFGANGDIPAPGDFDGDGKTDRAVFRPNGGDWYILLSSGGVRGLHFGQNGDKPVVGDYDGDGKSDVAVIRRENGQIFWYISQSSDGAFVGFQFGINEDKTVVADYNGDGKSEIAVWRPSNGFWYLLTDYANFSAVQFGASGDIPEPAYMDADRKADFAVFRPSSGVHYILQSSNGNSIGVQFGANGDIPIASAYVR